MKYKKEARDFWGDKLPKRVEMLSTVRTDLPFVTKKNLIAHEGQVYDVKMNVFGAVFIDYPDGSYLGLKPGEFDVVEWQEVEFE